MGLALPGIDSEMPRPKAKKSFTLIRPATMAIAAITSCTNTSNPSVMLAAGLLAKKAVEKGVPKPAGDNVKLGKVEAARFAVLRFGGGRTAENEKAAIEKLTVWLDGQKLVGKGDPIFAYYDPPWTPVFMRRNEVMIRIDKHRG